MPLLTQAEYARHRKVSAVAVHKAVKAGRINLVNGKIDQEEADRLWKERSQSRPRTLADGGKQADPPPVSGADDEGGDPTPADYFAERARRERAEADIAEMKAAQLRKELVPVADVERQWSGEAGRVREAFLQLADRLAPVLEMRPIGFIRQTLDVEVRQVLTSLSGAEE